MTQMTTSHRDIRIKFLKMHGINVYDCSPGEWLQLAIAAEALAKDCGPFDPAYLTLIERAKHLLEGAAISELISQGY